MIPTNIKTVIVSICFLLALCASAWAQPGVHKERKREPDPELADKVNPHWTGKHCTECHEDKPKEGRPVTFKFDGDFIKLCNRCHDTSVARASEHLVGIEVPENKYFKKPAADFPLQDGKLTCITCHDARIQEKNDLSTKEKNSMFLRKYGLDVQLTFEWNKSETADERYSQNRYVLCFECHKTGPLLQWSPHKNQLNAKGEINEELCLFCHIEVPDVNTADQSEWKLRRKNQHQCLNCHMGKTRFHPIRVTHYGNTVPAKITNQIEYSKRRVGVLIPMENDAQGVKRLVCNSCHNPHQRGVLKNPLSKKGADSHRRLRLDGFTMCLACHGAAVGSPTPGTPF